MTDYEKIVQWNKDHTHTERSLFVDKLVKKRLTYSQIVTVLKTMDEVCNICWDSPKGCQCWNDE